MAKISPVSIKYMIHATFTAQGALEKPDVIGALFGQTEGLLGADLEMRELQKEGKIGRIEVDLDTANGKTTGEIEIPSSLDKSETTIIAAAIETIERIGPSDAEIKVTGIEDVRSNKREYIIERAKKLMETIEGGAEAKDIGDAVKVSARMSKLQEYGTERLPAGDLSGDEIIVVEGRADVINLIRNGIKNVVGMNGTNLPDAISELGKEKEITLFIDGDRGGRLIAKNVCDNAKVKFITTAPDGKEVEELTGKEILAALRKKVAAEEFLGKSEKHSRAARTSQRTEEKAFEKREAELNKSERDKLKEIMSELSGTRSAVLLDSELKVIRRVGSADAINSLNRSAGRVFTVMIDGTATSPVIRAAEKSGCSYLIAKNFTYAGETSLKLISF